MTEHSQELSRATGSSAKTADSAPPAKKSNLWWLLILVAAISLGLIVWSSSPSSSSLDEEPIASDKPARDVPYLDGQWIRYSAAFAERNKLSFVNPANGSLSPVV